MAEKMDLTMLLLSARSLVIISCLLGCGLHVAKHTVARPQALATRTYIVVISSVGDEASTIADITENSAGEETANGSRHSSLRMTRVKKPPNTIADITENGGCERTGNYIVDITAKVASIETGEYLS